MSGDKETRKRLLESAAAEFYEKGYMKASLRKICADAGVTTGALYFFFKDKEDLFAAIVGPPYGELKKLMVLHFADDEEILSPPQVYEHADGDHDEFSSVLIHHLYSNYDAFMMLLEKSQGSRFETSVDEIVGMIENAYRSMAEKTACRSDGLRVNAYMLHWLTHMTVDAFIHLITHERDEGLALKNMRRIMDFLVEGWMKMIFVSDEERT